MTPSRFLLTAIAAALMAATALADSQDPPKPGWKLVWSDEFETAGPPDPAKWTYETGMFRNQEAQCYTKDRLQNVRVENNGLVIEARKEHFEVPDKPGSYANYTSGSIQTLGRKDWLYGRIEVKAKLPAGRGMRPAIWMLPVNPANGMAGGEIDIMENIGYDPDTIYATIHTKAFNSVNRTQKYSQIKIEKSNEGFRVYAVEWDEKKIAFYVDDSCYFTFYNDGKGNNDTWPFNKPFYLKLNTAVGGSWGGMKGIDESAFPNRFYIDYVRVYQRATP